MKKHLMLALFLVLAIALSILFTQTVRTERDGPCAAFSGAAYGLCTAYCEAMECGSDDQHASNTACQKVLDKFFQLTKQPPPCYGTRNICICDPDDLNNPELGCEFPPANYHSVHNLTPLEAIEYLYSYPGFECPCEDLTCHNGATGCPGGRT